MRVVARRASTVLRCNKNKGHIVSTTRPTVVISIHKFKKIISKTPDYMYRGLYNTRIALGDSQEHL